MKLIAMTVLIPFLAVGAPTDSHRAGVVDPYCGCSLTFLEGATGGGAWLIIPTIEEDGECEANEETCLEQALPCEYQGLIEWLPPNPPPCPTDNILYKWTDIGTGEGDSFPATAHSPHYFINCEDYITEELFCMPQVNLVASLLVICWPCGV
jgi:hypothetical protein